MFPPEKLWYGFPGTHDFNAGSFMWGFVLCLLSTIVVLQQTLPYTADRMPRSGMPNDLPLPPPEDAAPGVAAGATPAVKEAAVGAAVVAAASAVPGGEQCKNWIPGPRGPEDPWDGLKMMPRVSPCLVNGLAIEELDPETNFRRGFALGFTEDVEDKVYLLPYLRATRDPSLHTRKRRVFIDLGAATWGTSTLWFNQMYPLDFTEIHSFERNPGFVVPAPAAGTGLTPLNTQSRRRPGGAGPPPVPAFQLARVTPYQKFVSIADDAAAGTIDVNRFIKTELSLTKDDAVIIKMDIEGVEWDILPMWLKDPEMAGIVDELFVEVHYNDPTMAGFGWGGFPHTRDETAKLLNDLRAAGYYVHAWP